MCIFTGLTSLKLISLNNSKEMINHENIFYPNKIQHFKTGYFFQSKKDDGGFLSYFTNLRSLNLGFHSEIKMMPLIQALTSVTLEF